MRDTSPHLPPHYLEVAADRLTGGLEGQVNYPGFSCHELSKGLTFWVGALPQALTLNDSQFRALWSLHLAEFCEITIHGRKVKTPRWQQAYGMDYTYSGQINKALEIPPLLNPLLNWACSTIDDRLNGILVNWYDGNLGHYIGPHRDSRVGLVEGAPIVTVSYGEDRIWRLRPWKGKRRVDFTASNGGVFLMPYDTNLAWTHAVPKLKRFQGLRISVTLRAFETSSM